MFGFAHVNKHEPFTPVCIKSLKQRPCLQKQVLLGKHLLTARI